MITLAIARLTFANGIRQPVVWLATGLGLVLLVMSLAFGQFNFDDDDRLRLLLTAGVAAVTLNGLFLGVMISSEAVHEELTSRTALTLFAKPIDRASFLLGKAAGAWAVAGASCLALVLVHLALVAGVEHWGFFLDPQRPAHMQTDVNANWSRLLSAHGLALAQVACLCSVAASLALRLPLVVNLLAVFGLYVLAHLLGGFGWYGAVIVPALPLLAIDEALQFPDLILGWPYLALGLVHAALYSAGSLLIGLALFKQQDIP